LKVNALIGGTQKGGTTALFDFLSTHPQIAVPRNGIKEVNFFDKKENFITFPPNYREYERLFQTVPDTRIMLEATPIYLYWAPSAERISAYNSRMRLIFLLRDPVARAYSQWEMEFSRGSETEPFDRAIELEQEFIENNPTGQHRVRSYLSRGCYCVQVRRFLQYFDRSQILLLRNDELLSHHERTLGLVCEFLDIDCFSPYPASRIVLPTNKDARLPKLSLGLTESLRSYFREDLLELHRLTGVYVQDWLG